MKKFALAAACAAALAGPAMAETKSTPTADPFVSTQGGTGLGATGVAGALVLGTFVVITVAAASGT